eukprot:m.196673 g.196673  ORF g.196673 m.196673 type:complete len:470 (+) comp21839_c0_seq3:1016-2425(+)
MDRLWSSAAMLNASSALAVWHTNEIPGPATNESAIKLKFSLLHQRKEEKNFRMSVWVAVCAVALCGSALALDNGLALTPPMGWLSWERYACETDCTQWPDDCISERLYMRMADALVDKGYKALGYEYVNIDDCWQGPRDKDGNLAADPTRFPSGIKALADYMHAKGLKLGIYNDIGSTTCMSLPGLNITGPDGSQQYKKDVQLLASWGIDSFKVDGCSSDPKTMHITYPLLSEALNSTGRPILYSCSWPDYERLALLTVNYTALAKYCNLWRIYDDIYGLYSSLSSIINFFAANDTYLGPAAHPGAWNDPDMIIIGGQALSHSQEQLQFAMWAILAGPLLMSNDLYNMPHDSQVILQNTEVIAVNQDKLGKPGRLVARPSESVQVWARHLANGDVAVALVNLNALGAGEVIGFNSSIIGLPTKASFTARNLFTHEDLGRFDGSYSAGVHSTSVQLLRVTPLKGKKEKKN